MRGLFSTFIYLGLLALCIVVLSGIYVSDSNRKAIEHELQQIAAHASLFYASKEEMGGGNGSFNRTDEQKHYKLPDRLLHTENAEYHLLQVSDSEIVVKVRSKVPLVGELNVRINGSGIIELLQGSAGGI